MANWLKALFREIRPNFLYDVTKWVVRIVLIGMAMLIAASYLFIQWFQLQPASLWAALVLFAVALFLMFAAPAIINKYQKRLNPTATREEPNAENTQAVEELNDHIKKLEEEKAANKWLLDLAKRDKTNISQYVHVLNGSVDYKGLAELSPYIEISFRIINASVYSITIDKNIEDGAVYLSDVELNPKMTKIDGSLRNISRGEREVRLLVIKQWLTPTEVERINNPRPDDKLYFSRLSLTIRGGNGDEEVRPERLSLPSSILVED
jgi:hypothetical protein